MYYNPFNICDVILWFAKFSQILFERCTNVCACVYICIYTHR